LDLLDTIYIDRSDIRQQFKSFEHQILSVKDKFSIAIAPEGTRNPEHEFSDFKAGAFKIAFQNLIPIQPIVIYGSRGLLFEKKHHKVSRDVYVTFLPYKKPFDFHTHNID
jgi:1-acyl-sn-glycerol-3-phosphate acyltransferase